MINDDKGGREVRIPGSDSVCSAIFDAADDAIIILKEGRRVDCNPAAVRMFRCGREDIIRTRPGLQAPLLQPDGEPSLEKAARLMQIALEGEAQRFDWVYQRADGSLFHSDVSMTRVDIAGEPHVLAVVRDVSERKRIEERLRESEEKFRVISREFQALLDGIPDGLSLLSPDLTVLWINSMTARAFGMEPSAMIGKRCYEVRHGLTAPCTRCPVLACFNTGMPQKLVSRPTNGLTFELRAVPVKDESGKIIKVIEIARDITEQKKLEMQLYQSQKMEAVGQLAGGIAHDFNNILTAVIGYASLMVMKMEENDPFRQYAEQIVSSSEKAAGLTKSLLAFGRKQVLNPQRVELKRVLENMEKLLRGFLREDIELNIDLCPEPLAVMADSLQLERVFMNLASNARDAMPDGGKIAIKTEPFTMDGMFIRAHGYGRPGDYVCVSFTDTGIGMDENTRNRVFEPFFTTKEVGKGTGLGLAMAYGIIKQHEGYINLYSEPGQGTTVRLYLPLVLQAPPEKEETEPPFPEGGEETILLAEDSENIRKSHREILENFGYNVIEAADGEDAIEKVTRFEERIDALVLDVVMPRKSGREVFDAVRELRPDTKVLFMSGHTAEVISGKGLLDKQLHFMAKPVSPRTFLAKLREMLTDEVS
jgi:two-component system cell cycle sensor histidine kinase/response regulator CckA